MPRSIAVALAALLLILVAGPASAQAKKRVAFVGPGESIQAAVDAARPGDTILVKGVHRENVAITTNGISLRGLGAVLRPPATPAKNACFDPSSPDTSGVNGICVIGDGDFVTGEVNREVRNVTVSGFRVRGFDASGIFAFAARNTTFARNVTRDNEAYGLVAFSSTGTRFLFNRASGSGEAGIYVGDSPKANALLLGNEVSDNLFGVFIRNALGGKAVLNAVHGNCLGVLVLADAPGPAGDFRFTANRVSNNTKACPASEEMSDPISGIGFALSGSTGVSIVGNRITGNKPSGESLFSGGVVVVKGDGGTAPTDNRVRANLILGNQPDLSWDGSGTGNVFRRNLCRTSTPAGLCD